MTQLLILKLIFTHVWIISLINNFPTKTQMGEMYWNGFIEEIS